MGELKSLAGQTVIYGGSSILGRLINYLLVMLHTAVFLPEAMGVVTYLYSFTAIFMIVYTYGMETTYFRYVREDPKGAYRASLTVIFIISTFLSIIIYAMAQDFATMAGHPEGSVYIKWLAIILWIDAISSIPFARLRNENRAKKFATIKVINILLNVGLQYTFLKILPESSPDFDADIKYIFLANLIANAITFIALLPYIKDFRFEFDRSLLRPMLKYGSPIFLMGLAGMLYEQLDKILIPNLLPDDFYTYANSMQANGIYGQTFKIAVFMMLAIQAFRYAGEPFFFSKAEDKKAPELFAKIMHYFVISGLLLFVLVSVNVDLIALIFLRQPEYRVALYLVPILLFGKLLYGIYINLSIWFKLTDKTIYGLYFSIVGVAIALIGNILLIPILGMLGAALSVLICYIIMCIICYIVGRNHLPIPYNFVKLLPYFITAIIVVVLSYNLTIASQTMSIIVRLGASLGIVLGLWLLEKRNFRNPTI